MYEYELETGYAEPNGNTYPDDTWEGNFYNDEDVAREFFNTYDLTALRQAFEDSDYDIAGCDVYKRLIKRNLDNGEEETLEYVAG